jgi:hypothetical protein
VQESLMEALLEARQMDVKAENFRSERVLNAKLFGAPNAFLPGSVGHGAIMGLCSRGTQPHRDWSCRLAPTIA